MGAIKKSLRYCKSEGICDGRFLILCFMVALYPLIVIPNSATSYFHTPRYIILAILAMSAVFFLFRDRVDLRQPEFAALAFFIAFAFISTALSEDVITSFYGGYRCTGFSTYLLCAILFILAYQSKHVYRLLGAMITGAAVISIVAVLQYYGVNIVPNDPLELRSGAYSTLGNPNWVGTYTVFILPAAILLYIRHSKLFMLVCSAIIYSGLLVSLTRGAWLAFFMVFLIIAFRSIKNAAKLKNLIYVILFFALTTLIILPANDWLIFNRALSIPGQVVSSIELNDDAGSGRIYIWKEALKILPQHWALGIGADRLGINHIVISNLTMDKAHNVYLEMAVTMGIFSLLSYLFFLSFFLRKWSTELDFLLSIMVLAYVLQGLTNNDVIMIMPVFWITLGFQGAAKACK